MAIFVNDDNHSLNLVSVHAAIEEVMMLTYFGIIKTHYVFFTRSTKRWEMLKVVEPVAQKSDSNTRWSAKNGISKTC